MKVLVVGNGGRECAIANALLVSPKVTELYITPPNYGVVDPFKRGRVYLCNIGATEIDKLVSFAQKEQIHLSVVGPEAPLAAGIVDEFRSRGLRIIGADKASSQLEASKSFAKSFMLKYGIPTAPYEVFDSAEEALKHLESASYPLVVKADGLAAGKGAIICKSSSDAQDAIDKLMIQDIFKGAGKKVLVEELLKGREVSFFCFFDGEHTVEMPPVTDYKRLKDNDEGPNTGGMGCICPSPFATPDVISDFRRRILEPFIKGCQDEGFDFRGIIYFGTIITNEGIKVLEFNVRHGDPEAQGVMPLLMCDLLDILLAVENRSLDKVEAKFSDEATVTVILASRNYPFGKSPPARIEGLERISSFNVEEDEYLNGTIYRRLPRVNVFFAGVSRKERKKEGQKPENKAQDQPTLDVVKVERVDEAEDVEYFATGGRVLAITARGKDLSDARRLAYEALGNIHFEGMQYRTDIGKLR